MKRCYDNDIGKCTLAVLFLLMVLLVTSCHKEDSAIIPVNESVTLTFSARLPMATSGVETYALTDVEEAKLKDIDVLVYTKDGSDWRFHQRTVGKISTVTTTGDGGGIADIEVSVLKTQVDSRLVILANVRKLLNAYQFVNGQLLSALQKNLVYELEAGERWSAKLESSLDYEPLPMWAEYDVGGAIDDDLVVEAGKINLLRSLARVDVIADGVTSNFRLDKIHVYNSNRNGLVIPNEVSPSLPASLLTNDSEILEYEVTGNKSEAEIYLFEAKAGNNEAALPDPTAAALVIEGRFDGNSSPSFYRIDFKDATTGNSIPLLRNHCYKINIVDVANSGSGASDRDAAFKASSLPVSYATSSEPRPAKSTEGSTIPDRFPRQTGTSAGRQGDVNYTVIEINQGK